MGKLNKRDIERVVKEIGAEFPNDPALQNVHISRKILAKEAELEGLNLVDYIISLQITNKARK